jgi:nuclease S1
MKRAIFVVLLFIAPFSQAWAWGEKGHSIIAEIAQRRLSSAAQEAIVEILTGTCK